MMGLSQRRTFSLPVIIGIWNEGGRVEKPVVPTDQRLSTINFRIEFC